MIQKPKATVADLYHVQGKAELVHGELIVMSPAGRRHGRASLKIARSLDEYAERHGGGIAFGDNVGFLVNLPDRQSFSPDAAWLATDAEDAELDYRFVDGAPTFAVEIRSTSDEGLSGERSLQQKIADYFDASTLVVWDVDLSAEVIRSYRSHIPSECLVFQRGEMADAKPAVPGWRFAVDSLFTARR
jgi:Uma2 family endonuclease